jgi:hypothetical protein
MEGLKNLKERLAIWKKWRWLSQFESKEKRKGLRHLLYALGLPLGFLIVNPIAWLVLTGFPTAYFLGSGFEKLGINRAWERRKQKRLQERSERKRKREKRGKR